VLNYFLLYILRNPKFSVIRNGPGPDHFGLSGLYCIYKKLSLSILALSQLSTVFQMLAIVRRTFFLQSSTQVQLQTVFYLFQSTIQVAAAGEVDASGVNTVRQVHHRV
jgi:hypothetical protein